MLRVTIVLEFEQDEVDNADVSNYLDELIDNDCLSYTIEKIGEKLINEEEL